MLEVGWMLQYIPYAVHTGVQAALGLVLLDLGLEASCEQSILSFSWTSGEDWIDFFSGGQLALWTPALISALGIFWFSKDL